MRRLHHNGVLHGVRFPGRVIAVGNIQAGGAGKTPIVAQIAREACASGKSVCVLIRGYGGKWERSGGVIAPGDAPVATQLCGDEAALLHDLAPLAWIAVGANRVKMVQQARERFLKDFDLLLLDDGFQHWRIIKDLEVVAVTSHPWGSIVFRDFRGALKYADLVVWTKGDEEPLGLLGRDYVRAVPRLSDLHGKRIFLVTGVADGKSVFQSAVRAGAVVIDHLARRDHAVWDLKHLTELTEWARSKNAILTVTGKDWVKVRELGLRAFDGRDGILVLEPQLEFQEGKQLWQAKLWD